MTLLRVLPSDLATPVLSSLADRVRRERAIVLISLVRGVAIGASALLLARGAPSAAVYALAVVATVVFTVFRPAHSALLPSLCTTTRELTEGVFELEGDDVLDAVAGFSASADAARDVVAGHLANFRPAGAAV